MLTPARNGLPVACHNTLTENPACRACGASYASCDDRMHPGRYCCTDCDHTDVDTEVGDVAFHMALAEGLGPDRTTPPPARTYTADDLHPYTGMGAATWMAGSGTYRPRDVTEQVDSAPPTPHTRYRLV